MLNEGYLYASLLWGGIGSGCIIYARRVGEWTPALAGIALIVDSVAVQSPHVMWLVGAVVLVAMRYLMRRGW